MTTDTSTPADDTDQAATSPETAGPDTTPADDSDAAKARREAADLRRRLKQAETMLAKHEEADKTELEKATNRADLMQAETDRMRTALRAAMLTGVVDREARALGITSPTVAQRLLDEATITWDDDTNTPDPKTVTQALRAVIREFPLLTRAGDVDHAAGTTTGRAGSTADRINQLIRGR